MVSVRNVFKKNNTHVLAFLVVYKNMNTLMFKVLGSVIHFIMDNYLCVDYLCLHQGQIYLAHKVFENTTYNYISGIVIP